MVYFQGLVEAFQKTMPNVEHRFYVKYMVENFKPLFKSIDKKLLWNVASSTTIKTFEGNMKKIKDTD